MLDRLSRDKDASLLPGQRSASGRVMREFVDHLRLPLFRNGYALLLNGAGTSGLGFVYWAIAARLYPTATVGLNSALLSAMVLLSGMAQLSLNNVLIRFIPIAGSHTRKLVLYSYGASLAAAVVCSLLFIVGVRAWSPNLSFVGQEARWAWSFGLATAAWCIFSLQDSALTGLRESMWVPLENIVFAVVKIVLLVIFAGWLAGAGIFLSWTVPVLVSLVPVNLLIFAWILPRRAVSPVEPRSAPSLGEITRFAGGNYLGTLFFLAYTNLLPLVVASRLGAVANAYFYLPWTIVVGLQLIATNMSISLTVEAALDQARLRDYYWRVFKQSLRLLLPLAALIFVAAPWFLRIFGANYAAEGTALLRWLALAALPNVLVVLALSVARVRNQSRWVLLIQGLVAIITLGVSYVFLPTFGIVAVGWAWFASQLLVGGGLMFTMARPIFLVSHD